MLHIMHARDSLATLLLAEGQGTTVPRDIGSWGPRRSAWARFGPPEPSSGAGSRPPRRPWGSAADGRADGSGPREPEPQDCREEPLV